jgi:uncharacterized protein YkwD
MKNSKVKMHMLEDVPLEPTAETLKEIKRGCLVLVFELLVFLTVCGTLFWAIFIRHIQNENQTCVTIHSENQDLLLDEINRFRASHNLNPVTETRELDDLAGVKAKLYEKTRDFNHNIAGKKFDEIYLDCGLKAHFVGENLARGFNSQENIVIAWSHSPDHLKVMSSTDYVRVGIFIGNKDLDNYIVTLFTN